MKNVLADRNERALYKLVMHSESDVVLGLHMIGPDALHLRWPQNSC